MHQDVANIYVGFIVHILAYANIKRAISDSKNSEVKSKEQSFQAVTSFCMCISKKVKRNKKNKGKKSTDKVFLMHQGSKGSAYSHNT